MALLILNIKKIVYNCINNYVYGDYMAITENERLSLPIWKRLLLHLITLIILAAQIAIIYFMVLGVIESNKGLNFIYFIVEGVALLQVIYVLYKPMNINYKLTWCVCILIIPLPSMLLYYFNSTSRRLSKRKKKKIHNNIIKMADNTEIEKIDDVTAINLVNVVAKQTYAPVYGNSKFTFFSDCYDKFLDMLEEMKKAEKCIYMEYFILSPGYLMDKVYDVLLDRGYRGVEIKIIYDDVGSKGRLHRRLIKRLAKIPNCKIYNFEPLGMNFNMLVNYRDHRKILVIDNKIAYCGGDNMADEYIHKKERFGYWRDNCGKYEGEIVNSFSVIFSEMWYTSTKERLEIPKVEYKRFENQGYIMAFGDGPLYDNNPSYDLFKSLILSAKNKIYISTPYFIIDDSMIELIALKAKSGVEVNILMPHIPDKKAPFYMGRANYRDILKAGGNIYEMTRGFNHAKNIIIDDKYAFIGTVNMDYRSLFLHYECGALIINSTEILKMSDDYEKEIGNSLKITYEMWKKRSLFQKITSIVLNIFSPLF